MHVEIDIDAYMMEDLVALKKEPMLNEHPEAKKFIEKLSDTVLIKAESNIIEAYSIKDACNE